MVKLSFEKNNMGEDKEVYIFLKGIIPKVKVVARLDFELLYFRDSTLINNAIGTPPDVVLIGYVLWHINPCSLSNTKSCLYYIRYELFGLVCWVLWHINLCGLFNAKSIFM